MSLSIVVALLTEIYIEALKAFPSIASYRLAFALVAIGFMDYLFTIFYTWSLLFNLLLYYLRLKRLAFFFHFRLYFRQRLFTLSFNGVLFRLLIVYFNFLCFLCTILYHLIDGGCRSHVGWLWVLLYNRWGIRSRIQLLSHLWWLGISMFFLQ